MGLNNMMKKECMVNLEKYDWQFISGQLKDKGYAVLENIFSRSECDKVADLYDSPDSFRSRIVMASHGFGSGEYKYFKYPLPENLNRLRTEFYERLVDIANQWQVQMKKMKCSRKIIPTS